MKSLPHLFSHYWKQDGLIWPHPLVSLKALRGADQAHLHQAIEVLEQAQKVILDGFFGVVADGGPVQLLWLIVVLDCF